MTSSKCLPHNSVVVVVMATVMTMMVAVTNPPPQLPSCDAFTTTTTSVTPKFLSTQTTMMGKMTPHSFVVTPVPPTTKPIIRMMIQPPPKKLSSLIRYNTDAMASTSEAEPSSSKTLGQKIFEGYEMSANVFANLFPLWTVLFTGWALRSPSSFTWFTTEYFTAALAALMLSMGITLTPDDFVQVAKTPAPTVMQFIMCYAMMPALAYGLGNLFGLSKPLIAGLVLVGCSNGGQASNLCTYIARGNVALSVLMTTATTLGAIVMTPLLCKSILGTVVPVDAAGIAFSTIQVVLAPIVIGMTMNRFLPKVVKTILPFAPVVGVASTCLLVASAVAQVADPILAAGWSLQIPILLLHFLGGLAGYFVPRFGFNFGETSSRTMAIETSMKSSAFAFLLAKLHFGDYAARIPAAVSVVWMALTGSLLAVIWRQIPVKDDR